jgi:hypothetical protein
MAKKNNIKQLDVPVEVTESNMNGLDNALTYKHPSYGQIRVSHRTGGFGEMYGSEVNNQAAIGIEISNSEVKQHLGDNWYHEVGTLVEIQLSPIQYAEMISKPNAEGVPCTIKYTEKSGHIVYKPHNTQVEYSLQKVKDLADDLQKSIKSKKERAQEILSKKGGLNAADKKELSSLFSSVDRELRDGIPFYTQQVKENAERMVVEAKIDAESLVTTIHNKVGAKLLNNPEILNMLLLENK